MFNQYLELTPENADISMANVVLENLKFIVISLDQIFRGHAGEDYYDEEYTFYFYHLIFLCLESDKNHIFYFVYFYLII